MKNLNRTTNSLLRAGYIRNTHGVATQHHVWIDTTSANGTPISFWEHDGHVDSTFKIHGSIYVDSIKNAIRLARL
jgi:hypothetical protein